MGVLEVEMSINMRVVVGEIIYRRTGPMRGEVDDEAEEEEDEDEEAEEGDEDGGRITCP